MLEFLQFKGHNTDALMQCFFSTADVLEMSNWTNRVAGWVVIFLSTRFLRISKRHDFLTLHMMNVCWEVNACLIFS